MFNRFPQYAFPDQMGTLYTDPAVELEKERERIAGLTDTKRPAQSGGGDRPADDARSDDKKIFGSNR